MSPLAGFKAGALNFALRQTAPDAEVVAVIDSDYKVEPHWLKELVPAFDNPQTAIVQAPQDYRDADDNLFKAMCHAEYRGFFQIGMVTRNERNAIIQHGTMTLVRRSVLESVAGWAEWCITEDADLGLKIFEAGYEATYVADELRPRPDAGHVHRLTRSSASAGRMAQCRSCGRMPARCSRAAISG